MLLIIRIVPWHPRLRGDKLRTDQRVNFIYFLDYTRPISPEGFFVALRFEDAGEHTIRSRDLPFPPRDVAVEAVVFDHLLAPVGGGLCEHIAASHSRAGKILLVPPSLDV